MPPLDDDLAPPEWLEGWRETATVLDQARIIKASDRATLALWCRAMAAAVTNSTAQNITAARLWSIEFGLTPSSRAKVVPTEATTPGSIWDEFDQMAT